MGRELILINSEKPDVFWKDHLPGNVTDAEETSALEIRNPQEIMEIQLYLLIYKYKTQPAQ